MDDVRGTLEKFIPKDYYQAEEGFLRRVEEESDSFRPFGEKIYSYTRASPSASGKGKSVMDELPEDDENAVVYEVWHVRHFLIGAMWVFLTPVSRQHGTHQGLRSIIGECSCLSCST